MNLVNRGIVRGTIIKGAERDREIQLQIIGRVVGVLIADLICVDSERAVFAVCQRNARVKSEGAGSAGIGRRHSSTHRAGQVKPGRSYVNRFAECNRNIRLGREVGCAFNREGAGDRRSHISIATIDCMNAQAIKGVLRENNPFQRCVEGIVRACVARADGFCTAQRIIQAAPGPLRAGVNADLAKHIDDGAIIA